MAERSGTNSAVPTKTEPAEKGEPNEIRAVPKLAFHVGVLKAANNFTLLGSMISVVALAKLGFRLQFGALLATILEFYQRFIESLLGWAEPLLRASFDRFGIHLHLYSHWKNVLVLMWLYIGADARSYLPRRRKDSAALALVWGGLIALVASLASAAVPLDSVNLLPFVFPVAGFVIYETGQAISDATLIRVPYHALKSAPPPEWRETFSYYMFRFALSNAAIGAAIFLVAKQAQRSSVFVSSVALLLVYIVGIATRNIVLSLWIADSNREPGQSFANRFAGLATGRLGIDIFMVMGGALLTCLFGARAP